MTALTIWQAPLLLFEIKNGPSEADCEAEMLKLSRLNGKAAPVELPADLRRVHTILTVADSNEVKGNTIQSRVIEHLFVMVGLSTQPERDVEKILNTFPIFGPEILFALGQGYTTILFAEMAEPSSAWIAQPGYRGSAHDRMALISRAVATLKSRLETPDIPAGDTR